MFTEKHILTNPYNHHKLSRTLTGFDVTTVDCNADKSSGWNGTTVNLTPNAVADTQKFSGWSSTGANITNSSFNFAGSDVTAKANFEIAKNVTTVRCNSTKNSGFIGDTASLSNTPEWNEKFSSYSITGSTLTGSNFKFTGSNITAQANFETAKDITLQTDGNGEISANKNYGFVGDIVTLSNTASAGYEFAGYSITGATLTGSQFTIGTGNVTAKAEYSANGEYVKIGTQTWMAKNLDVDDGGSGIYTANVTANGVDFGTQYYYTTAAAKRIADTLTGWHLPTSGEWNTLLNYVGTANAGKRLKSTTGWNGTGNGLDTYGFSAIPVSYHQVTGIRSDGIGSYAHFSTSGTNAAVVFSNTNNSYMRISLNTAYGMSVRLVHD
jgi:uncharacterized protein (TIGR02145 family)